VEKRSMVKSPKGEIPESCVWGWKGGGHTEVPRVSTLTGRSRERYGRIKNRKYNVKKKRGKSGIGRGGGNEGETYYKEHLGTE